MASNIVYLTEAGLQKLKDELDHLRSVERPAISAAIAEARDKGDLSENAEYDAAKEAQGMLEMRIAKLEDTVANARVIDESRIDTNTVQILNRVKMKNMTTGKIVEYTLVSENEANLKEGKLAIGTPIAQALLGKKKSDSMTAIRCPFTVVKAAMPLPPCRMPVARAICSASSGKSLFSRFSRSMPRVLNRVFKALGRYGTISSIGYACPRKSSGKCRANP